ncbi:hypothetical protein [Basilea psittacipulmonis]|uniref:Transposase IS200-like domain-containing protein n=1 Tax=Basilea psittacipulmonis DSM 24701 TaxID=1072685 RepID=A0A077DEZ0_9BURK|nr:hypothetical protein [Basilea psittacipulmonis]AIL33334.1 hypothetical protein IX83_08490 [Basilea psittacipulmonis DSM 24701]
MARLPRLYAEGVVQLVQVELVPALLEDEQLAQFMYSVLSQSVKEFEVDLHSWLFLNHEIYLLATPKHANSMAQLVQQLGRHLSSKLRQGKVFKRRYRSSLIQDKKWALPAMLWIESYLASQGGNVVPEYWKWSSAGHHTGLSNVHHCLVHHADYWVIGNTPFERQQKYYAYFKEGVSPEQSKQLREALTGQWVLGDADFLLRIEPTVSRRMRPRKRGRGVNTHSD